MKPAFEPLTRAVNLLGWAEQKRILEQMARTLEDGTYFVAFVGQYSAGKSYLINNLLRRDLLPLGTTETTPLLTYIRYGAHEEARLHYCDGAVQIISTKQVQELRQNSSAWELDKLEYLEIFLPEELLRQGMIFLDTPGVNTLIQRHQHLLNDSLSLASKVVYVSGHALSQPDTKILNMLASRGLDISFVRTHFDEIKTSEENPEDVRRNDCLLLGPYGLKPDDCYHLSNLPNSKWYEALDSLRQMLTEKGIHAQAELLHSVEVQLSALAQQCISTLEDRRTNLEALCARDNEALQEKCAALDQQIRTLGQNALTRREQLQGKLAQYQRRLNVEVTRRAKADLEESAQRISFPDDNVRTPQEMSALLARETEVLLDKLYRTINSICDMALADTNQETAENVLPEDWTTLPTLDTYVELEDTQDRQMELLFQQLQQIRQDRSALKEHLQAMEDEPTYIQLQKDLQSLDAEIIELRQEYTSLPPYEPQMIVMDDGKLQPSQVMKVVGNIADWALMLVPGGALGAAAGKLATSSKVVNSLAKVIGGTEKIVNIVKQRDTIKDTIYALRHMSKTYATAKRVAAAEKMISGVASGMEISTNALRTMRSSGGEEATILDRLTIQYWAEQIGKKFDTPPRYIVDTAYEEQYRTTKSMLEQDLLRKQQAAYQKKCALGLYKSQQAQMEAERQSKLVDEKQIQDALTCREEEIRAAAEKAGLQRWHEACAQWYVRQMDPKLTALIAQIGEELPNRFLRYQQDQLLRVENTLRRKKQDYEALLQTPPGEYTEQLKELTSLLEQLREVIQGD